MLKQDTLDTVHSIFGTPNQLHYNYLWGAKIVNYFERDVIIAVVKTLNELKRGLLLIPPIYPPLDRPFGGPNPIAPIDLKDWHDPVKDVLQSVNLMPEEDEQYIDDEVYSFSLGIYSSKLITFFNYGSGPSDDDSIMRLWKALISAIKAFSEIYNDKEINACLI